MSGKDLHIKTLCFEYIIYKLLKEESDTLESDVVASYTRLRSLKLLFLTAAVTASKNSLGLLDIFDNFYAMQHGPVESDIYDAMVHGNTSVFNFSTSETKLPLSIKEEMFRDIESKRYLLDESIDLLLKQNPKILSYDAFRLVDITHKWQSWKMAISYAYALGRRSERMRTKDIQEDEKYFS